MSPTAAYDAGVKFLSLDADARSTKSLFNIIGEPAITDRYWVFFQDHLRAQSKLWVEVVVLKVEKILSAEDWKSTYEDLSFWLLHTLLVQGSCTVGWPLI